MAVVGSAGQPPVEQPTLRPSPPTSRLLTAQRLLFARVGQSERPPGVGGVDVELGGGGCRVVGGGGGVAA